MKTRRVFVLSAHEPSKSCLSFGSIYVHTRDITDVISRFEQNDDSENQNSSSSSLPKLGRFSRLLITGLLQDVYFLPNTRDDAEHVRTFLEEHVHLFGLREAVVLKTLIEKKYTFKQAESVPFVADYVVLRCASGQNELLQRFQEPRCHVQGQYSHVMGLSTTPMQILQLQLDVRGPTILELENTMDVDKQNQLAYGVNQCKRYQNPDFYESEVFHPLRLTKHCFLSAIYPAKSARMPVCITLYNPAESKQHTIAVVTTVFMPADHVEFVTDSRALYQKTCEIIRAWDLDVLIMHDYYNMDLAFLHRQSKKMNKNNFGFERFASSTKSDQCSGRLLCNTRLLFENFLQRDATRTFSLPELLDLYSPQRPIPVITPFDLRQQWYPRDTSVASTRAITRMVYFCETLAIETSFVCQASGILEQSWLFAKHTGSFWSECLQKGTLRQIDTLLMFEFSTRNYILPENIQFNEMKRSDDEENQNSKKFTGGLVFEPLRGLVKNIVLLLDFQSLYPSIIQKYSICFNQIKHWQKPHALSVSDSEENKSKPAWVKSFVKSKENIVCEGREDVSSEEAVLPVLITSFLTQRKQQKQKLKLLGSEHGENSYLRRFLERQEQTFKRIANSIFGSIGSIYSRFSCLPIAQLIATLGRFELVSAQKLIEETPYQLLGGDTDSLFVDTGTYNSVHANEIATILCQRIKKATKLTMKLDASFRPFLFVGKKAYVGLKSLQSWSKQEVPTLEKRMVASGLILNDRSTCVLAQSIFREALFIILGYGLQKNGLYDEKLYLKNFLPQICQNLWRFCLNKQFELSQRAIPLKQFVITNRMKKSFNQYDQQLQRSLPHLVAVRELLTQEICVVRGSFIEYVVCENTKQAKPYLLLTESSHLDTVRVSLEWYTNSILKPVERVVDALLDYRH